MNVRLEDVRVNVEENINVYDLVTHLSKHILQKYRPFEEDLRTNCGCRDKLLKRLRIKAFEILLNKTDESTAVVRDVEESKSTDPILEILKYAFVLRLSIGRSHDAETLEHLLRKLDISSSPERGTYSVLRLLIYLKSFKSEPQPITDIFSYGEAHSEMPNYTCTKKNKPLFQICPMESLVSSGKFEATLEARRVHVGQTPRSVVKQSHLHSSRCASIIVAGTEFVSSSVADTSAVEYTSHGTLPCSWLSLARYCVTSSNWGFNSLSEVTAGKREDENDKESTSENDRFLLPAKGLVTNYEYLCTHMQLVPTESENIFNACKFSDRSLCESFDRCTDEMAVWNYMWSQTDSSDVFLANPRTWEAFGRARSSKELSFATDVPNAAVHLAKIQQTSSLALLPETIVESAFLLEEIPFREFLRDARSMLLGVESRSFEYEETMGFVLRKNISIYGVRAQTLESVCQEAVNWGTCFRFLSSLVASESGDSKYPQEGLIFKAMCTNVKELLLYYRAALLRILSTQEKSIGGLLKLFQKVRPLATLIVEVSKLCKPYKSNQRTLGEGNSILTRIYKQVTKVTDAKVALVFYSILKSCCEVYFRFLQKWMFEGLCNDIYGEFMIKARPQYLRNRGHKFWTKSFSISNNAVPGFLNDLTESILQCGKTVRLLRICDPQNPLCAVCTTEQPEVKVCLSVTTLREQLSRCKVYEEKGKNALGPVLSLCSAIRDKKDAERETTELVDRAQRKTLSRIHGEREEHWKRVVQDKRNLFESLKEEAAKSDWRKRKERREPGLPNENVLWGGFGQEWQGETRDYASVERMKVSKYYEDLTGDIDKRRARSRWRTKRMSHFEQRVEMLAAAKRDYSPKFIENNRSSESSSLRIAVSYEDENMNYSARISPSSRPLPCDGISVIPEEIGEHGQLSLTNYTNRRNNEKSAFQEFLKEQTVLEELNAKAFAELGKTNDVTATMREVSNNIIETESILKAFCPDGISLIERPTFLPFERNNDASKSTLIDSLTLVPRKFDMTPNNNELDISCVNEENESVLRGPPQSGLIHDRIERFELSKNVDSNANENTNANNLEILRHDVKDSIHLHRSTDLETPMSCTTDHFTSSMQSPTSQVQNSEDYSPTEILNGYESSSCRIPRSTTNANEESSFSNLFGGDRNGARGTSSMPTASLTMADVEMIDRTSLQVYLEKSIRIPLKIQSRLVNDAIIKYFLKEHELLSHLHSLRSYFFLLNGEFAKVLTDSLYARLYEISIPVELFNSATLTNLLERALVSSFSSAYVNSELVSLSAIDTPLQLYISNPNALDCLSLNYKITWPLNIVLDDTVMLQYGKVFKFLVTSGRVSWVLREDFNIMKRERKAATSKQYHKLQLYRHSMMQFMNALHNYLTCSVLHASWTEFERDLETCSTVDQIYLSHVNYLKRILSRCMLKARGEEMRVCLNNIFKVILKFHNRLRSQNWHYKATGYVHPNFTRLEQMYRAFCELRAYMAHVASKLATSGYQPHLTHFLNALNINQLYDLNAKPYPSSAKSVELK